MAQRTFVHVGPPKTGTTYLQAGWREQRARLLDEGLLFPGEHPADQFRACMLALESGVFTSRMDADRASLWSSFRTQIGEHSGDALLSSEFYSRADLTSATRIVTQLREVSAQVHVVITARDFGRQVLASWQQSVKRGSYRTLGSFWRKYHDAEERPWKFWRNQDIPALAQRWIDAGADSVTLVVVGAPGAAREQVWHDLCDVLGVAHAPVPEAAPSNSSLGAVEIEVLRRMNKRLPSDIDRVRSANLISKDLTDKIASLGLPRVPVAVSEQMAAQVQACGDEQAMALAALATEGRINVIGDLDHLHPQVEAVTSGVDEAQVTDAALRLLASFVPAELEKRDRDAALRAELQDLRSQVGLRAAVVNRLRRQLSQSR